MLTFYFTFLDLINKYILFIKKILPEKNNTNVHSFTFNGTVLNIPLKKGIYKILHIIIIDEKTAPTRYGLVKSLISNIECLSDLHSNTWNNCDITNVQSAIVLHVAKSIL